MKKTLPDINETLLSLSCEVLQKIQETLPRHDIVIQSLEPRLGRMVENFGLQQTENQKQLEVIIERSFQCIKEKMEPIQYERESLLSVLCRLHSDNTALLKIMVIKSVDDEIINRTKIIITWLERFLESQGIELITFTEGLPFDAATMQIQRKESQRDYPNGVVIRELSPGYRIKSGEGYHYLNRAQVVINIKGNKKEGKQQIIKAGGLS